MRIAELSRRTGVSVATIKFYLREGLLPPGTLTARNQADYDESHVHRLDLIRALREGAGLSIAAIGRTLAVMDDPGARPRVEYLATAVAALSDPVDPDPEERDTLAEAKRQVDELLAELGWDVDPTSPGRHDLVAAVAAVHRFLPGLLTSPGQLRPYADSVRRLADVEIPDDYDPGTDPEGVLRYSVLGTVLFEPVLLALRKLAHVDRVRHLHPLRSPRARRRRRS